MGFQKGHGTKNGKIELHGLGARSYSSKLVKSCQVNPRLESQEKTGMSLSFTRTARRSGRCMKALSPETRKTLHKPESPSPKSSIPKP